MQSFDNLAQGSKQARTFNETSRTSKEPIYYKVKRAVAAVPETSPMINEIIEHYHGGYSRNEWEDIRVKRIVDEESGFFHNRAKTRKLLNALEDIAQTIIVDDRRFNANGQAIDASELKFFNSDYVIKIDDTFLHDLFIAQCKYSAFYIVPFIETHLNKTTVTLHVKDAEDTKNTGGTISFFSQLRRKLVQCNKFYHDGEDAWNMMQFFTINDKGEFVVEETEAEKMARPQLMPMYFENDPLITRATLEHSLIISDHKTALYKDLIIGTGNLIYNQDIIKGVNFDTLQSGFIELNVAPIGVDNKDNKHGDPIKVVAGEIRGQQFAELEKIFDDQLAASMRLPVSNLGAAPSDAAINKEVSQQARRTNSLRSKLEAIVDEVVAVLTQRSDIKFMIKRDQEVSEQTLIERQVALNELGVLDVYELTRISNPHLDEDGVKSQVLTNLIRNNKVLTLAEETDAIRLGLISSQPPVDF